MHRKPWPDEERAGRADARRGCLVLGLGAGLLVSGIWAAVRVLGLAG